MEKSSECGEKFLEKGNDDTMIKKNNLFKSADGVTDINYITWRPDGEIKAILQIAHGMVEYIDRYDEFACYLARNGIMVTGNDHLGHGESVRDVSYRGYFADEGGNEKVLADMNSLMDINKNEYPGIPYFFMGHSMGSFLVRQFLHTYTHQKLNGAVIMGTGYAPYAIVRLARIMAQMESKIFGATAESKLVNRLALGKNNEFVKNPRTKNDWLTKDEKIVDMYNNEPRNKFVFTNSAYVDMFSGIETLYDDANLEKMDKNLPVFIVSGDKDPVGNMGKDIIKLRHSYVKLGINDLQLKLYENDRHEILNELDRDQVYQDILEWMERHI